MKPTIISLAVVMAGLSLSGCYTPSGQPDNTASGALAGGATGAIIGSMAREPGPGALVGAAVGAVAGGAIGHRADHAREARLQAQRAQAQQQMPQAQPIGIQDVKAMAKAGLGDQLIISQIQNSRTLYRLNSAEIIDLKNSGVSEKVIDYMINTPNTVATSAAVVVPPAQSVEQIIIQPEPEYIWYPAGWFWFGGRWMWRDGYWGHHDHGPRYGGYYHHGYGHR